MPVGTIYKEISVEIYWLPRLQGFSTIVNILSSSMGALTLFQRCVVYIAPFGAVHCTGWASVHV